MLDETYPLILARLEEQGIRLDKLQGQLDFSDRMLEVLMHSVVSLTVRVDLLEDHIRLRLGECDSAGAQQLADLGGSFPMTTPPRRRRPGAP